MVANIGGSIGKTTLHAVKNITMPRSTATSALEGRLKAGVTASLKASGAKAKKMKIVKAAVIKKVKF